MQKFIVYFYTLILVVSITLLFSCRKLVQSEFADFKQVPTVNSFLKADSLLKVHISLASKLDTNELKGLNNAQVQLYVDNVFKEFLTSIGNGFFISTTIVEPSKKYECKVNIPGFETVDCSNTIPKPSHLRDIIHISVAGKDQEGMTYPAVKFTFSNNPAEKKYYEARIRLIEYGSEQLADMYNIIDPVLLNEGLPLSIFSNELITDTAYTMTINYITGSAGSSNGGTVHTILYPFILEVRSVSYDYYQFARQKYLYDTGRFPEFGLSSNQAFQLFSNVKNGYGIFAGYSSVISDTITPQYN
ncbi:MAG: DUF4249 family protein [Bacteroidota bacterium]